MLEPLYPLSRFKATVNKGFNNNRFESGIVTAGHQAAKYGHKKCAEIECSRPGFTLARGSLSLKEGHQPRRVGLSGDAGGAYFRSLLPAMLDAR